jgi:hypothetical protein
MIDFSGIAQIITSLVLVATFVQSYRNGQKLNAVKEQTNGLSSHLVKLTGEAEFAKGLKQGEENPK